MGNLSSYPLSMADMISGVAVTDAARFVFQLVLAVAAVFWTVLLVVTVNIGSNGSECEEVGKTVDACRSSVSEVQLLCHPLRRAISHQKALPF